MAHETSLIATIAMGLVFAFAGGFVASRLRLPPLVGYLLAGVAVGPFTPGFVADAALAGQLAEIGVILLMFGVGLHFSIADLLAVRGIARARRARRRSRSATALGVGLALAVGLDARRRPGVRPRRSRSRARSCCCARSRSATLLDTDQRPHRGRLADRRGPGHGAGAGAAAGPGRVLGGQPRGEPRRHAGGDVWLTLAHDAGQGRGVRRASMLVVGTRVVPWLLDAGRAHRLARAVHAVACWRIALGIAYGSARAVRRLVRARRLLRRRGAERVRPQPPARRPTRCRCRTRSRCCSSSRSACCSTRRSWCASRSRCWPSLLVIVVGKSLAAFAIVLAVRLSARARR